MNSDEETNEGKKLLKTSAKLLGILVLLQSDL